MTMRDFVDKSLLFKQVDNSQLDEMNYNLWRKASLDATSSASSHSDSGSPVAMADSLFPESNLSASSQKRENVTSESDFYQSDIKRCYPKLSAKYLINQSVGSSGGSPSSLMSLTTATTSSNAASPPSNCSFFTPQSTSSGSIGDQLCTLYMDMTYDDRIFFGVHNFYQLKQSLLETQCNIDFSAADNKVSIIGQVSSVQKMCELFISNSTLALQFEFRFFDEKYLDYMKTTFVLFHQQCELYHKVFVTYRKSKPSVILFNFLSFRNNGLGLIRAMMQLKNELEFCKVGEFIQNITSTMQIPANRRDLTGRSNSYIEQIQTKTQTNIEVIRYEDCPQYPFENVVITGQSIPSVIQARFELASRFNFELKFQVSIKETRLLVDYISKLSYDLKSVFISIEPCNYASSGSKIIAITGNEKSIGKLFTLRDQLISEVKMCNSSSKKFLT